MACFAGSGFCVDLKALVGFFLELLLAVVESLLLVLKIRARDGSTSCFLMGSWILDYGVIC